jgi:hypothetical protein
MNNSEFLTDEVIEDHTDGVDKCSICLSQMEDNGEEIHTLDCTHQFHQLCIDRWLAFKPNCPLCRRPLADFVEESSPDRVRDLLIRFRGEHNEEQALQLLEERIPLLATEDTLMDYMLARFSIPFLGRLLEVALRNTDEPILNNESPITEYLNNNENQWLPIAMRLIRLLRS